MVQKSSVSFHSGSHKSSESGSEWDRSQFFARSSIFWKGIPLRKSRNVRAGRNSSAVRNRAQTSPVKHIWGHRKTVLPCLSCQFSISGQQLLEDSHFTGSKPGARAQTFAAYLARDQGEFSCNHLDSWPRTKRKWPLCGLSPARTCSNSVTCEYYGQRLHQESPES